MRPHYWHYSPRCDRPNRIIDTQKNSRYSFSCVGFVFQGLTGIGVVTTLAGTSWPHHCSHASCHFVSVLTALPFLRSTIINDLSASFISDTNKYFGGNIISILARYVIRIMTNFYPHTHTHTHVFIITWRPRYLTVCGDDDAFILKNDVRCDLFNGSE